MKQFEVAIVGGGPAGSSCAAFCALAGLRTLLLEREKFPREKVCGDCLNPSCWPVLDRLGLAQRVRDLQHAKLLWVEFIAMDGQKLIVDLPGGDDCEISVKRSLFDDLLLRRAGALGADVREQTTVSGLSKNGDWKIETVSGETFQTRMLIGAGWTQLDGRALVQFTTGYCSRTCGAASACAAAARLWKARCSAISAGRLFGTGSGKRDRVEPLPCGETPYDLPIASLGGTPIPTNR